MRYDIVRGCDIPVPGIEDFGRTNRLSPMHLL